MLAASSHNWPYESNDRNPVLTTRHLSYDNYIVWGIHCCLEDDRWFMVALGVGRY